MRDLLKLIQKFDIALLDTEKSEHFRLETRNIRKFS
ncbi:hypothetical protein Mal48_16530 [Thalassoglobus polymorphus]|uniref:Uncharacterized protein n=1 Tax=Thalassoglobus polymorphus TaxID=2527994 RepID=A0A517QLJ7_9PLAN|nr:hypothetical protein Mal48_16530 [Thalassoglobus polymorphus]